MKRVSAWFGGMACGLLSLVGCVADQGDSPIDSLTYPLEIPAGFPQMPIPADNYLTVDRVALGKKLFFDPILSRDGSVSCGSCHLQEHAFADTAIFSRGIEGRTGFRNAPTLFNLAWHPYFFMDGGVPTLELQVLAPLDNHAELDMDLLRIDGAPTATSAVPGTFSQGLRPRTRPVWTHTRNRSLRAHACDRKFALRSIRL